MYLSYHLSFPDSPIVMTNVCDSRQDGRLINGSRFIKLNLGIQIRAWYWVLHALESQCFGASQRRASTVLFVVDVRP